jgi:hypothetical protein
LPAKLPAELCVFYHHVEGGCGGSFLGTYLTLWPAQRGMTQCERKEFTAERGRINASWVPSTVKLMNFWEQVTSLCIQGVKHVIPKVREIHDMERQIKERQVKLRFDPRKYWTR